MSNPTPKRNGASPLPEFMTSVSVADFIVEWLDEQVQATERRTHEEGNSRALGWELRTLRRAHGQLSTFVAGLAADES